MTIDCRIGKALATIQKNFRYAIFITGLKRSVRLSPSLLSPRLSCRSPTILSSTHRVRHAARQRQRNLLRTASAIRIQIIIRRYLSRRRCVRLAQSLYAKYLDADTHSIFWSNKRLGSSHWFKPKLLRELDCGDAIKMPTADEQYTPLCSDCQVEYASLFCDECDRLFCSNCSNSFHSSGQRKLHHLVVLEMCVECEYQVPTKQCLPCDELYCDTCFHYAHRRGRSRLHTYRWVTKRCDICEIRAAHFRHIDTWNLYAEELYCTICLKLYWGDEATHTIIDSTGQYETYRLDYYGPSVMKYKQEKLDQELLRAQQENYQRLAQENLLKKFHRNAMVIQRVWRGRCVRASISYWIERRKYFLSQRDTEASLRDTRLYRLGVWFGWPPKLKYETNKEKCLKRFPKYLHEVVGDCVERKWGKFVDLVTPSDLGPGAVTPDDTSRAQAVGSLFNLLKAKLFLYSAEKGLERSERRHQHAREKYRVVS
jgi:hypothetical protein